jgi:LDH2 family malate/lactate/ureidoglycolate dehydrogenase
MTKTQAVIPEQGHLRVNLRELLDFTAKIFISRGISPHRARIAAEMLCYAEASGAQNHGLIELARTYIPKMESGQIRVHAEPLVIADRGATALIDYRHALGLWAVGDAMDRSVGRARLHGIGMVSMRGVGDFGRVGHHAARAIGHGMIGLVLAAGGEPGIEGVRGLNPLGMAAPAGPYPSFVFDLDAAAFAAGDAQVAAGFMLLVEVLAGLLAGVADHDHDTGLLLMAISPSTLRSADGFYRHASALFGSLLGWESGAQERYPGWRESQRLEQCEAMGVPLSPALYRQLGELGAGAGVSLPVIIDEL